MDKIPIKLRDVNSFITCRLCNGYLVDATTITECLHTFCRSCIVSYLENDHNTCPKCDVVIHQSSPLQYIISDVTMQEIVVKLIPHIQSDELKREKEFYERKKLKWPRAAEMAEKSNTKTEPIKLPPDPTDGDFHRSDEQINLQLESGCEELAGLERKFVRCSVHTSANQLKKLIAKKIGLESHDDIDLYCEKGLLGRDHSVKFVHVTKWRRRDPPIVLHYHTRSNRH